MSFLAPGYFVAALIMAAAVLGYHFIVTRQPPSGPLPTARFVPAARVEITTLARRPEDLLLLLIRTLLLLLVGAAFARPVLGPRHRPVARIVVADISRAVRSIAEVRDSARTTTPDLLFVFDSVVRPVDQGTVGDWAGLTSRVDQPGSIASALISAMRAGAELRSSADSIELVIVSPLAPEEWDAATLPVRASWPGRIRLIRVRGTADSASTRPNLTVRGGIDDPVRMAAQAAGLFSEDAPVRVIRGTSAPADSVWAAARGTLVRWPADSAPMGWSARARRDTSNAVYAHDVAVIYPFERRWTPGAGIVVARWMDGEPAATEHRVGSGCIRDVSIPVQSRGDLILRSDFARLLRNLTLPCGMSPNDPVGQTALDSLAGTGPLASRAVLRPVALRITPLVPWLLAAALLLGLIELLVRGRSGSSAETP